MDKLGIRFTGLMSCSFMVIGVIIKYIGVSTNFGNEHFTISAINFDIPMSVAVASLGFSIFGMGCEICGITVSKIITKWFNGHELALAMGIQVALSRLGTAAAMMISLPVAKAFHDKVSAPVLLGAVLLIIGALSFFVYNVMDKKLSRSVEEAGRKESNSPEEPDESEQFRFKDLGLIFSNPGFWCITLLCMLFYSGVFPFLKFATKLMVANYGVSERFAGILPGLIPFGTIFLTPLFGTIYDKVGKGATLMLIGSIILTVIHIIIIITANHP